jgi:hypothetical protein
MQRRQGNAAMARAANQARRAAPIVQAKLVVTDAGDHYEQEADRAAAGVMRGAEMPSSEGLTSAESAQRPAVTPIVQRDGEGTGMSVSPGVESAIQGSRGGGQALPESVRGQMERGLGADFAGVRVHTGSQAHALNEALQARAFTIGHDIFFRAGEYQPGSTKGREILAHELAHVVQQGGGAPTTTSAIIQRKWVPFADPNDGLIYYHHVDAAGVQDPRVFKHVKGVAFIDTNNDVWSEYKDQTLYVRNDIQNRQYNAIIAGINPISVSPKKFNFDMRLPLPDANNILITSNKDLFDEAKKLNITVINKKKPISVPPSYAGMQVITRAESFEYLGVQTSALPGKASKKANKPASKPNGKIGGTKTRSIKILGSCASAGRSSTETAMGVSAKAHAAAHNKKLPGNVQPASNFSWEWLHLIGDAIGGPTDDTNLACGTSGGNSMHNAQVESVVLAASAFAKMNDPLEYEVQASLIPQTAIAKKFECTVKFPKSMPGSAAGTAEKYTVDTLTPYDPDRIRYRLERHQARRKIK